MNKDRFLFRYYSAQEKRYLRNSEIQAIFGMSCLMQKVEDTGLQAVRVSLNGDNEDLYVTEQCTGLKDQSGKLIFEGDVVDYYAPMADDHYQGVVTFDDNETTASGYYIKGKCEGWQSYLDGSHCRIIGNVHQMEDSGYEKN